jgi:hypothetical protein
MEEAMNETAVLAHSGAAVETVLRDQLARGDALVGTIAPILRHLLANEEHSVFSDEIIARVCGMMEDMARQLLDARAEAAGQSDDRDHPDAAIEALKNGLVAHPQVLAHVHALAMEWQLTERLHARLALDPVLSPLLQALISSTEPAVASNAMALLAAQARFVQCQRRMQLPLTELPGDLLHAALLAMRAEAGEDAETQTLAGEAERKVRGRFDESRSRLGLIARIVTGMGGGAGAALSVTHAGVAIFASALALASGQDRDMAVLATNEGQLVRLALALRASGLKPAAVEEQFLALHPDMQLPEGIDQLGTDRAAALLALSTAYPGC